VMRPLFYEFPSDPNVLGIDQQFMIGSGLLFSPCLTEGATSVDAYFPQSRWFDFWSGIEAEGYSGNYQTLETPLDFIPIHIRGGSVIPTQVPSLTSTETRQNAFTLTIALDENGAAAGELYYDDGEDLNVGHSAMLVSYSVTASSLSASVLQNNYSAAANLELEKIVVLGLDSFSGSALINGKAAKSSWDSNAQILTIYAEVGLLQLKSASWSSATI
jgi:alpha-glucosidase (family GH31 glycosyl hydrolase)